MSVVKINALQIPPQAGDEIVKRFTARLDELSAVEGFEGFELLRPTGDAETRWFVYTRWADEASYQAWRASDTFARSHAQPGGESHGSDRKSNGSSEGHGGHGHSQGGGESGRSGPVAMGATLLEFEVAVAAGPGNGNAGLR